MAIAIIEKSVGRENDGVIDFERVMLLNPPVLDTLH